MKKLIILLMCIFLCGCSIINTDNIEFLNTIQSLTTPELICNYMKNNFEYGPPQINANIDYYSIYIYPPDPCLFWKTEIGYCLDFAYFGIFTANYHGYETYLFKIFFKNTFDIHYLAVYKENGYYNYSSNQDYYSINTLNFYKIVEDYFNHPIIHCDIV